MFCYNGSTNENRDNKDHLLAENCYSHSVFIEKTLRVIIFYNNFLYNTFQSNYTSEMDELSLIYTPGKKSRETKIRKWS